MCDHGQFVLRPSQVMRGPTQLAASYIVSPLTNII